VRQQHEPRPAPARGLLGPAVTLWLWGAWALHRFVFEPLLLRPTDWCMDRMSRTYGWLLHHTLNHRWWVMPASLLLGARALVFALGVNVPLPDWAQDVTGQERLTVKPIGKELVPSEDQNRCLVNIICPVGSSIDYVDEMLQKGEQILAHL